MIDSKNNQIKTIIQRTIEPKELIQTRIKLKDYSMNY